jgi:hypothetical protein
MKILLHELKENTNMVSIKGQYAKLSLEELTEKLAAEYYESIERLCADVYEQVEKIKALDPARMNYAYLKQCYTVIDGIKQSLTERRERIIPYLMSLTEKVATGHNCGNCSNGCKVSHDMHLMDVSAAAKKLKNIQADLQLLSLPLYVDTHFPDQYRVLRNMLALVESDCIELFFMEENYLIPKVIEAQKAINVSGK